jgi:GNAT superfamily N-acetyltransferase
LSAETETATVRRFRETDAEAVTDLFRRVNRLLAPAHMKDAFERYIAASIADEMGRVADYYADKGGSFWVAEIAGRLVGMFGLEPAGTDAMELRRMYVDPDFRRRGIARLMLEAAEDHCRAIGCARLDLSTSEVQPDALAFYRASGYVQVREEVAEAASNKTIGGGIRRYHFEKLL